MGFRGAGAGGSGSPGRSRGTGTSPSRTNSHGFSRTTRSLLRWRLWIGTTHSVPSSNRPHAPSRATTRLDVVSAQLGHSNVTTTATIYAHVSDAAAVEAAELVGRLIQGRRRLVTRPTTKQAASGWGNLGE